MASRIWKHGEPTLFRSSPVARGGLPAPVKYIAPSLILKPAVRWGLIRVTINFLAI